MLSTKDRLPTDQPRIGAQIPNIYIKKSYTVTKGDAAIQFLNNEAGMFFAPWQEMILRDWLATEIVDGEELWAHMDCCLVVARQEGKSELIVARLLVFMYLEKGELAVYSSHRIDSSVAIYKRMRHIINNSPSLKARTKKMRTRKGDPETVGAGTIGRESFETLPDPNDPEQKVSRVEFRTRKADGGRGFTAQLLILDEAAVMTHEFAEAVRPTLAALGNPQIIAAGSAGNEKSEHFGALRNKALSDDPGDMCWHEWSVILCDDYCEDECDEHPQWDDEETWYLTNPTLGFKHKNGKGKTMRFLRSELGKGEAYFQREYLSVGRWPQELDEFGVIKKDPWNGADADLNQLGLEQHGRVVFCVQLAHDMREAVITVAGYTDDTKTDILAEIVDTDDGLNFRSGTQWVVPELRRLCTKTKPYAIIVDAKGQGATNLIEAIKRDKGIKCKVLSPTPHEYAESCADYMVGVTGTKNEPRSIYHYGQADLTKAVAGAATRKLAGLWAWARANDSCNILPLEGVTLAVWGLKKAAKEAVLNGLWSLGPGTPAKEVTTEDGDS